MNNNAIVKQNKNEQGKLAVLKKGKTIKDVDTKNQTKPVTKVIDKCFQNVWRKERELEKKLKQAGVTKWVINPNSGHNSNLVLQGAEGEIQQPAHRDGVNLDIEGTLEELDYVDDIVDEELSDFDEVTEIEETVTSAEQLSDEQLVSLLRVKNLFNKFWEEKMSALNKGKVPMSDKDKQAFVKSPSDTTIYAPALKRTSQVINQNEVNNLVSNFVDTVRLQQKQSEMDLQEKEQHKASSERQDFGFEEARAKADRTVLEAEKFRPSIANPDPGMVENNPESSLLSNIGGRVNLAVNAPNVDNSLGLATGNHPNIGVGADNSSGLGLATGNIPNIGAGISDDDFFHLTCFIDPNLSS